MSRLRPLREGRQELALRLEPPELGTVVVEAVLRGRHLTLQIVTQQETAHAAVESGLSRLRDSLVQLGLVADQVTVQLGLGSSPREFAGGGPGGFERGAWPQPVVRAPEPVAARPRGPAPAAEGLDLWA